MSLTSLLEHAQGGRLFAAVARSLDIGESQTRSAMGKLCPVIAERLHARAAEDEALFQSLLDLIADNGAGSLLEEGEALTGPEAVADGNAILDDVFGSRSAAMAALRQTDPALPERELAKLAPISATAVVAALAEANRPLGLAAAGPQAAAGGSAAQGFLGALISAIVAGIVAALTRKLAAPTRRRRSSTGYARSRSQRRTGTSRSRAPTRRRSANASIEDIFKDILGNLGKQPRS